MNGSYEYIYCNIGRWSQKRTKCQKLQSIYPILTPFEES